MKFGIWVLFEVIITILGNAHCWNAVLLHIAAYLQLQQQKLLKISLYVKMPRNGKFRYKMTQLCLKTV